MHCIGFWFLKRKERTRLLRRIWKNNRMPNCSNSKCLSIIFGIYSQISKLIWQGSSVQNYTAVSVEWLIRETKQICYLCTALPLADWPEKQLSQIPVFVIFSIFSPYCCKIYGAAAANTLVNTFVGICFSFNNNY